MIQTGTASLVTLLMPFRNGESTLAACLDSILAQTDIPFELLAVDDGSEDRSAELVRSHADRLPSGCRLRLLQPGRIGLVAALNLGLTEASAPLVARMDADDVMYPQRLSAQADFLHRRPEIDLVACRVRAVPEAGIRAGFREYMRWQNGLIEPSELADEIYWESPVVHPSVMFRRQRVLELGGYREGPFPEDYELWLRMVGAGCRLAKLPRVLLDWTDHADRLTRTDPRYGRQAFDRLRAHHLAADPRLATDRPLVIWGAGRHTRKRVKNLLNHGFTVTAWIDVDPNKIGHRVWEAPVVPPSWLDGRDRPFILSYVIKHGAREEIRLELESRGYRRGRDYLMVG